MKKKKIEYDYKLPRKEVNKAITQVYDLNQCYNCKSKDIEKDISTDDVEILLVSSKCKNCGRGYFISADTSNILIKSINGNGVELSNLGSNNEIIPGKMLFEIEDFNSNRFGYKLFKI